MHNKKVIRLVSLMSRSACQCVEESGPINSDLTTVKSNPQVDRERQGGSG